MLNRPEIVFKIVTIFPEFFDSPLNCGIIKRAIKSNTISVETFDLREFSEDKHNKVDDTPFGGGEGMVMKVDVFYRALKQITNQKSYIILTDPAGRLLTNRLAKELSQKSEIVILCGRYEGVDERIKNFVDLSISCGPYVLSGGEYAALCIIDAISRYIPGVIGNPDSVELDSFRKSRIKHPQYTKPRVFKGMKVPEVLLSGDHKEIKKWRELQSKQRTEKYLKRLRCDFDQIIKDFS